MASDHQHDRKYDRRKVLEDEKSRIIVLRDFHQEPPEVGIYDEPVRYFKANKEWCQFIFGWLTWAQDAGFWAAAEDHNYHAIQQMLIFEEGITGEILMTPEELKTAIAEGQYLAWNRLAAQVVSGRYTDIAIDESGNVSQPSQSGGDAGLPEDDPITAINESLAAKAGGAIAVRLGLSEIFETVNDLHTEGYTNVEATDRIFALYQWKDYDSCKVFVWHWYSAIDGAHPYITSLNSAYDEQVFCVGNTPQTLARFAIDFYGAWVQDNVIFLSQAITQAQLDIWFNRGLEVPSTMYQTYFCTKSPTETLPFDMSTANTVQRAFSFIWKKGHRILVTCSGIFSDSDNAGYVSDAMYEVNPSGVRSTSFLTFNSGGQTTSPTNVQVPYESSHNYQFTLEKSPTLGVDSNVIVTKDNGVYALPNTSGILTVTLEDLGYFGI